MLFYCLIALASLTAGAPQRRRDYPWTVSLTVSDKPGSEYDGQVEVMAVFKNGLKHAVTLPSVKYEQDGKYTFPINFMGENGLDMLYVRTKGFCPLGFLPFDVLRLSQVEVTSVNSNTTYTKYVNDLAIKDACQPGITMGTALTDFDEFNPSYCLVDGKRYADGEQFDMGCTARCRCQGGQFGCVDRCTLVNWSPEQKCYFVHVPGQCCDDVKCDENEKMHQCSEPTVANAETDNGEKTVATRRYPWAVFVCIDAKCSQVYGGVIVGNRHVMMYGPDMDFYKNVRVISGQYVVQALNATEANSVRVVNVTTHPDFVNTDSPIADSASRLQLLEVQTEFTFDKDTTQAANLPYSTEQCVSIAGAGCQSMTVGWDRTDVDDQEFKQWFLHAEPSTRDEDLCKVENVTVDPSAPKIPLPRLRGDKRICIGGLKRDDCVGPVGGAAVTSAGGVDFVTGLVDMDSALFTCRRPGTTSTLPLCKYTNWVTSVTSAINLF